MASSFHVSRRMPGPAESWSRNVVYVFAVAAEQRPRHRLAGRVEDLDDRIDRRPGPAGAAPRRPAARPSSRRTGPVCASPGFVRMPSAEPGTRTLGAARPDRPQPTGTRRPSPSAVPSGVARHVRSGTAHPRAEQPRRPGRSTRAVSAARRPRFTPSTWTSVVRPRCTPSGKTPVTTGTSPTCRR